MFFRRKPVVEYSFGQRVSMLREAGFRIQESGEGPLVVIRDGCAAVIEDDGAAVAIRRAGWTIGGEVAALVSVGYQTIWRTPSGHEEAATSEQLKQLHGFLEDLRELLGLTSLYNQSLGATHTFHDYDRVDGREPRRRRG